MPNIIVNECKFGLTESKIVYLLVVLPHSDQAYQTIPSDKRTIGHSPIQYKSVDFTGMN